MAYCYVHSSNGGGVNVRASKSVNSSRLGTIPEGAQVNIVTCDAIWATLVYNGVPAFVQHQYISNPPSDYGLGLGENSRALCNTDNVNVRSEPRTGSSTNGSQLDKGDSVTVTDYSFDGTYVWYLIGTDRWVRGDFLAPADGYSGSDDGGVDREPTNAYEMYGPDTQVLRNGSRGQAVKNLQYTLVHTGDLAHGNENDFYENVDGVFGTKTELAVAQFQAGYGLTNDGIVGNATKPVLWEKKGKDITYLCSAVT